MEAWLVEAGKASVLFIDAMRAGSLRALHFSWRPKLSKRQSDGMESRCSRAGAIAVIRTMLNYFLERDLNDVRERQHEHTDQSPTTSIGR